MAEDKHMQVCHTKAWSEAMKQIQISMETCYQNDKSVPLRRHLLKLSDVQSEHWDDLIIMVVIMVTDRCEYCGMIRHKYWKQDNYYGLCDVIDTDHNQLG